jgi:ribosomal protein L35
MKKKDKKFKVKKSVRNRFKITKTGKVMHLPSFGRHLRRKKSRKQIRRLKRTKEIKGAFSKKIKKLLGKG